NHCILVQAATYWCPDREEHGYFLTLVFKCTTNPPVFTAHRWKLAVDVLVACENPRTDDLTTSEWELLSTSTTQFLIKKPAGRKSASPQNTYEAYQLYGAGALRAWCVGLRHIVFNNVYRDILEYSRLVHWTRGSGRNALTQPLIRTMGVMTMVSLRLTEILPPSQLLCLEFSSGTHCVTVFHIAPFDCRRCNFSRSCFTTSSRTSSMLFFGRPRTNSTRIPFSLSDNAPYIGYPLSLVFHQLL
ncbi:hypothetical protein F5141DRAFT_1005267, partial [Pisolithus sp. B1]